MTTPTHKTIANTNYPNTPEGWLALHHMHTQYSTEELEEICRWNDANGSWEAYDFDGEPMTESEHRSELVAVLLQWAEEDEANERGSIAAAMRVQGFEICHTGGGCHAFVAFDPNGQEYLIAEEAQCPDRWRSPCVLVSDNGGAGQEIEHFDTVGECLGDLAELVHRTGQPFTPNQPQERPALTAAELDKAQRHIEQAKQYQAHADRHTAKAAAILNA